VTTTWIGSIEAAVVSDGELTVPGERMFGSGQPEEWRRQVHFDEHGGVPFSVNCLLVRVGERRILLDTGVGRDEPLFGARYGSACGRLVESLRRFGVEPAEIDTVVVSHAHGDHIGGATERMSERYVPTFRNARYWIWKGEWEYWTAPDALNQAPYLEQKLPPLADHGQLELADAEIEIAPGVRLVATPGHTPGHLCVALTSGAEMAIYTGDLLHHPAQFDHPEWSPGFDLLPEMSAESRRRILEVARREGALLLTAHLPTPGVARPSDTGGWDLPTTLGPRLG
jgi:glyoxylase-like metal-dependent hydrolase (beta-lactamase superfamily II)